MTTNPHVIFQYFDTSDYKQHSKAEMKLKILLFLFSYAPINPSWASIKHHTLEAPSDPGPSASCIYTLRIPTALPFYPAYTAPCPQLLFTLSFFYQL